MSKNVSTIIALVVGSLLVALFVFILGGESIAAIVAGDTLSPIHLTVAEQLEMLAVLLMCGGVLLAWRWPFVGGWMTFFAAIMFILVESLDERAFRPIWFTIVFLIVGAVLMLSNHDFYTSRKPST